MLTVLVLLQDQLLVAALLVGHEKFDNLEGGLVGHDKFDDLEGGMFGW